MLDTLEVYEFYHMALMLCKRYHLSNRQGKYLVLMCSKYSNLNTFRINYLRTTTIPELRTQQREVSILAHEAIHNVLTLCDSDFLGLKPFNTALTPDNSLGV